MSYTSTDQSPESGSPVYLYEFNDGTTVNRFTDSDQDLTYNSLVWSGIAINHSEIKSSSEISKNSLNINFLITDDTFQSQFVGWTPDKVYTLTLFRGHVGETEIITYWKGRITSSQLKGQEIQLNCESLFTSLKRAGITPRFQRSCRHALYSTRCGVNQTSYELSTTVNSFSNLTLTISAVSSQSNGYYAGGIIEFADGSTRLISTHTGSQITINRASRYLSEQTAGGFSVKLYPGCDRTRATCASKFSNGLNFGGFPWIPSNNPFDGSSIA